MTMMIGPSRFLSDLTVRRAAASQPRQGILSRNYPVLAAALAEATVLDRVGFATSAARIAELQRLGVPCVATAAAYRRLTLAGVSPSRISFVTNGASSRAIALAYAAGVRQFWTNGPRGLARLARLARGSGVVLPLGRDPQATAALASQAAALGLQPLGLRLDVDFASRNGTTMDDSFARAAAAFAACRARGVELRQVVLGGGVPARYRDGVLALQSVAELIRRGLLHFGAARPDLSVEGGPALREGPPAGVLPARFGTARPGSEILATMPMPRRHLSG